MDLSSEHLPIYDSAASLTLSPGPGVAFSGMLTSVPEVGCGVVRAC
jgi:hypothetical protein